MLPFVLLAFLGIIEYGRYLMTQHVFNNAVRYGAVYAAKHSDPIVIDNGAGGAAVTYGAAATDVQNAVTSDLAGMSLGSQSINVFLSDALGNNLGAWTSGTPAGTFVCVQITGTYTFMLPSLLHLPSSLNTTFQSVQPSEGN